MRLKERGKIFISVRNPKNLCESVKICVGKTPHSISFPREEKDRMTEWT